MDNRKEAQKSEKNSGASSALQTEAGPVFFELTESEELRMSENGGKELWQVFLEHVAREKGEILFASIMGSRRYNLAVPGSDLDLVVVYVPKLEEAIGVRADLRTFKQKDNLRPDFSISSVEHFCSLLLDGDAKCIELLFSQDCNIETEGSDWSAIKAKKEKFISKRLLRNYASELRGNKGVRKLNKLVADKEDKTHIDKCAYILARIAFIGNRFLSRTPSPVWFENGTNDYEILMKIRRGELEAHELLSLVEKSVLALENGIENSDLPESPSESTKAELQNWYLKLRKKRSLVPIDMAPRTQNQKQIFGNFDFEIPGQVVALYRDYQQNTFFGVYARNLSEKLWSLIVDKGEKDVLKFLKKGEDGSECEFVFYEIDRLYNAFTRSELHAYMICKDSERLVYSAPKWLEVAKILPTMFTNTLVYTSCGYLSGRFKSCRGAAVETKENGFASLEVSKRAEFASYLLEEAIEDAKKNNSLSETSIEGLEKLSKVVNEISRISGLLVDGTAQKDDIERLIQISRTFSKDFVALRAQFASLFRNEIDALLPDAWIVSLRLESA